MSEEVLFQFKPVLAGNLLQFLPDKTTNRTEGKGHDYGSDGKCPAQKHPDRDHQEIPSHPDRHKWKPGPE